MEAIAGGCAFTPAAHPHRLLASSSFSSCRPTRKFSCRCSAREATPGDSQKHLSQSMSRRRFADSLVALILLNLGQDLAISNSYAREERLGLTDEEKLETIQLELRKVLKRPKAAGILRLVFHDAGTFDSRKQTGGMNGSILYELDRPENSGLDRSIKILDTVKASLDMSVQVSWADLIAVAGAEAVAICGGPKIPIKLGRLDTVIPDPEGELPAESLNASSLKSSFSKKGFT
eukprot:c23893_g1_i1 orf=67-765(+)